MSFNRRVLLTEQFADPSQFQPNDSSLYIFAERNEKRTLHMERWQGNAHNLSVIEIAENGLDAITLVSSSQHIALRDQAELASVFSAHRDKTLYLDITGLSNHVWPALLKIALALEIETQVMYVEPQNYTYSASPRENVIFDLSERILGISPIPQFGVLTEPDEADVTLIPLLGFEGARFSYLLEEIQPPGDNIEPIIGIPGFRAEYPFFAYQGNQIPLKGSRSYQNVRFSKANCPFSLYYSLSDISELYGPNQFFKIGLIGTKPHALGAVIYSLINPGRVELVYDHTKRKPDRTTGHSHCIVYPVSRFVAEMKRPG